MMQCNKLKTSLIIFFLAFSNIYCLFSQSKNLVLNPDFEEYYECPKTHNPENQSHKLVPGWSYPSFAAPDYFNRCGSNDGGVPQNFAGNSEPKSGNGYVGAILTGTEENRREYIQGELAAPMVAGQKYCITYHYRLASGSRLAVDQLSVYFSNTQVKAQGVDALSLTPQLSSPEGLFLDNVEDWEQICQVYEAKGGEKFFIIGNFKNYENTNYVVTDKNVVNLRNKAYAYYYFDDVAIKPIEDCRICPCVLQNFEARVVDSSYTGGKDPITGEVKKIINDGRIRVAMLGGTPPYKVEWNNKMTGSEIRNLAGGKYTYVASDYYNCKSSGTVTFIQPVIIPDKFEDGLRNIQEGSSIVLENIFFEFNKTTLLPESYPELNKVASFMLENNISKIEISGHTDSEGSDAYNQKLSEGRANAVIAYLIIQGVNASRMTAVGYGESRPIETNLTEEGKAQNRRVEFTLVKR
ncbi:MAG: OmpA family protein [Bacteroidales bacterium]|nr:OmpA family protein [Bacteroidales bacterium]